MDKLSHPSVVVSVRLTPGLHTRACTAAGAVSVGVWLRGLAAREVGGDDSQPAMPKARRRHRPPSLRQQDIRDAVRVLGALGAAVAGTGSAVDLADAIRTEVGRLVALVSAPR